MNTLRKRPFVRAALWTCVLLAAAGCCSAPDVVVIGAPHDRFDHNRTVQVAAWTHGRPEQRLALTRPARTEAYTPTGHTNVPHAPPAPDGDGLPAASLVPVFVGMALPLRTEPEGNGASDRADLIDFLGMGPQAGAGVERNDVQGALPNETERRYDAVLRLLDAEEHLATRASVLAWAGARDLAHSFDIVDSRYDEKAFGDRVALRSGDFWFVLFQLPKETDAAPPPPFTRLVVVPALPLLQTPDKGPQS